MATFTVSVPINIRWNGHELVGQAGATHRISDALADEFAAGPGSHIPGFAWVVIDEASDALLISQDLATAAPPDIDDDASVGVLTSVARADHTHGNTRALRSAKRSATIDAAPNSAPTPIAHRGLTRSAPENTLAAFGAAIAAGAKMFEIDIVWSADGVPMILHDTTVDRTVATYSGSPANFTAAQLRRMDAGSHYSADFSSEGIPSLYDLFERWGDKATWIVEIKANYGTETLAQTADRVADIIHDFGLDDYCILASFSEISGSTAFTDYGIPFLAYSGGISADGSVDGVAASTLYNTGYRYVGTAYDDANLGAGANILGANGIRVLVYTVHSRYDRDVAIAASTAVRGIIADDFTWIDVGRAVSVPVGSTLLFSGPRVIPAGVVPFKSNGGSGRAYDTPSESGTIGWASGRLGWPTVAANTQQQGMVLGPLGWGASGLGKFQAIVTADATTASTRFAGLAVYSDDRGHVAGGTTNTATGYEVLFRQSGVMEIIRIDSTGAEVTIATATASVGLVQGNSYTVTLEVTANSVIATFNGTTLSGTDSTYRNMTYCGILRSQLGCTISEPKRIS